MESKILWLKVHTEDTPVNIPANGDASANIVRKKPSDKIQDKGAYMVSATAMSGRFTTEVMCKLQLTAVEVEWCAAQMTRCSPTQQPQILESLLLLYYCLILLQVLVRCNISQDV